MDDIERSITFQIKGTAYRFKPLSEDHVTALVMLSGSKNVSKMFKILAISLGEKAYDELTDRLVDENDSLSTKDVGKAIERLIKESSSTASDDD